MIRSLKSRLLTLPLRNNKGGIMIEFGFAMPVLILLLLGGVELGRYVLLHQKLDRTAMTVSDLVARVQSISVEEIDTILTAADLVMAPFAMADRGTVFISSVEGTTGTPKVRWQRNGAGTLVVTSEVGAEGANANISDPNLVSTTQGVIIGETYFEYSPWFIDLIPSTTIRHIAVFRPRLSGVVLCVDCP